MEASSPPAAPEARQTPTLTADVKLPVRSRTFTEDDARKVLVLLKGAGEGQNGKPAENVGYGTFKSPAAARSAGESLNRLLQSIDAPHKYALTTFQRDGQTVGVLLNKQAKKPPAAKGQGRKQPPTAPR